MLVVTITSSISPSSSCRDNKHGRLVIFNFYSVVKPIPPTLLELSHCRHRSTITTRFRDIGANLLIIFNFLIITLINPIPHYAGDPPPSDVHFRSAVFIIYFNKYFCVGYPFFSTGVPNATESHLNSWVAMNLTR
jgi:hypothetical protein